MPQEGFLLVQHNAKDFGPGGKSMLREIGSRIGKASFFQGVNPVVLAIGPFLNHKPVLD